MLGGAKMPGRDDNAQPVWRAIGDMVKMELKGGLSAFVKGWALCIGLLALAVVTLVASTPLGDRTENVADQGALLLVALGYGAFQGLLLGWMGGLFFLAWRLWGGALLIPMILIPLCLAGVFFIFRFPLINAGVAVGSLFVDGAGGLSLPAARIGDPILALVLLPIVILHAAAIPGLFAALAWLVGLFALLLFAGFGLGSAISLPFLLGILVRRVKDRIGKDQGAA
jgi:hypothetical protein